MVCLVALGFATQRANAIRLDSGSARKGIAEVLALRLTAPQVIYRAAHSPYSALGSNGALVLIQGERTVGAVQPLSDTLSGFGASSPAAQDIRQEEPIEMRVAGRTVYFDREVESFAAVDLTGRQVIRATNAHEVSLHSLRAGIYILRGERRGASTVLKVILR